MSKTNRTAIKDGTKLSWKRAAALHELAGTGTPSKARAFLAAHKQHHETLDSKKKLDKRNPAVRAIVKEYTDWLQGNQTVRRPSKGDPEKPVRGGAPRQKRKYTKRGGRPRTGNLKDEIPYQVLAELRNIQKKHGVPTADLLYYADLLGRLCDDPADIDAFVRRAKETRKAMA